MRYMMIAAILVGLAAPLGAKTNLRDVPVIDDGLFAMAIANVIRKGCPEISARIFRAMNFVNGLEREARALGYTDEELDAHVNSEAEKAWLRQRGAAYFKENATSADDADSLCALGRREIATGSAIGQLLRVQN